MKNKLSWILLAFALAALNTTQAAPQLMPLEQQPQAALLSAKMLTRHHYKHAKLDDSLSSQVFDNYLEMLDSEKVFFLQADIDHFADARTRLDDGILDEDLSIPFAIYNLYQQRMTERFSYASSLLTRGFDFKKKESYQYTRKDAPWPKSEGELNDLWRKRVKNDWLRLKLAGKDKQSIVATLGKRYRNSLNSLAKVKSEDAFETFMNAYATAIDPHTNYFGVRASEEFDISMKLSLVGIGAVLNDKDDYTTIRELLAGGPAALSGELKAGDRIVGVGQGENGPMIEITGWRIDDAVALIRGEEGSVVRLDVLPAEGGADGKHKLVSLVRKKISLDKQAARKSIIEVKDGAVTRQIGVISLPGFYQDFAARLRGDKDFRSATRDVSLLLDELKKDKVEGVLVDLRNNGGGSLNEAIELTGLFIDQGPVVQQRDSGGRVYVEGDTSAGLAWNGPLGVLINRASASASEIFAAAIQDYGRGVVIGERSFGKGTVQSVADLDQIAKNDKPVFGELTMTIAQFFRINGDTTQLRGVTPDISLPTMTAADEFGESSFDNALPWTQIKAADYTPATNLASIMPTLIANHSKRIGSDKDFKYFREDIAEFNILRRKNLISLNEADRRKEREAQEAREKAREKNRGNNESAKASAVSMSHALHDDGMLSGERDLSADLAIANANKNAKDIFLNEASHVLSDAVGLLNTNSRLAANSLPQPDVR
ncbi:MAG: tail-specific protease [Gallionellales bacterium RIFCSPLOWO2_02_FULL_57_47]|nr:MAG: tail-specific protease [Gallionellales bacterium RIFCSPLOWO2_02_FULL_57_47]OGT14388.1 MAG: tail-specific protease [Gallionellales bacterium RIFCSPHIGHO2_02_FULL_57_16]